jgi:hypothetical protein
LEVNARTTMPAKPPTTPNHRQVLHRFSIHQYLLNPNITAHTSPDAAHQADPPTGSLTSAYPPTVDLLALFSTAGQISLFITGRAPWRRGRVCERAGQTGTYSGEWAILRNKCLRPARLRRKFSGRHIRAGTPSAAAVGAPLRHNTTREVTPSVPETLKLKRYAVRQPYWLLTSRHIYKDAN